ncbi:MAG: hypothetical protein IKS40_07975, partial [Treponema sp.]|nr:hypothetical protein [Treponema sp.]
VYNYKHKPRIAGEPAFSISRFRDWKPFFSAGTNCYAFCPCMPCFDTDALRHFFSETVYHCGALLLHLWFSAHTIDFSLSL